ncbi:hypothetical protein DFJ66_7727 [Saccharothrix variisporea]|uniref:Uncharacterized protein n=1 Tax=Saccharothrix variisporea TaxID=543527 RepID=A0A495XIR1_9PSEU|nr:hypothetical protein DFJ66_7727 [Saccharothrix variisporea]
MTAHVDLAAAGHPQVWPEIATIFVGAALDPFDPNGQSTCSAAFFLPVRPGRRHPTSASSPRRAEAVGDLKVDGRCRGCGVPWRLDALAQPPLKTLRHGAVPPPRGRSARQRPRRAPPEKNRTAASWQPSVWHWIKRGVIGHGYKPGRACSSSLEVFIFALTLTFQHRPPICTTSQRSGSKGLPPPHRARQHRHKHDRTPRPTTADRSDDQDSTCHFEAAVRLAADLTVPLFNANGRLDCNFKVNRPRGRP